MLIEFLNVWHCGQHLLNSTFLFQDFFYFNGVSEILTDNRFVVESVVSFCSSYIGKYPCVMLDNALYGPSPKETNRTFMYAAMDQIFGGGSWKQLFHYFQIINSGILN